VDDALIGKVLSAHGIGIEKNDILHTWNENEPFVDNTEGDNKIFFRLRSVSEDNIEGISTHLLKTFYNK